jgi:hypothetical protein
MQRVPFPIGIDGLLFGHQRDISEIASERARIFLSSIGGANILVRETAI